MVWSLLGRNSYILSEREKFRVSSPVGWYWVTKSTLNAPFSLYNPLLPLKNDRERPLTLQNPFEALDNTQC
jgi:hypothetical protein